MSPWIGWAISTLLLLFIKRKRSSSSSENTATQQPSKFTDDTGNQIGNSIPVVIGRAMIKNPLVSYYGDYSYRPYTEEYGLHSDVDADAMWWPIILGIISQVSIPTKHPVVGGMGGGVAVDTQNGIKNAIIVGAVQAVLVAIMQNLFNDHLGRTTIQKGFLYYLGWQHILCWTGENFGLKKIWMNVYDTNVEQSTEQGVWGSDDVIWKHENVNGIIASIDDINMFGGYDEGGGFTGHVHVYFGTESQPFDAWMQEQMTQSANVPDELKGLTPRYPMFVTCVVNGTGVYGGSGGEEVAGGAYIGKQATVPEMWFEVVNYPKILGFEKIGEDCNPAEVIAEILINSDWGCNYDSSLEVVDIDSLKKLGNICQKEGLGISCLITNTAHAYEYIDKILTHINAVKYDDPVTGKLTFKMIRGDYNIDDLKKFDMTNCESLEFTRLDWSETTSSVSVNFTLAENKYVEAQLKVSDVANPLITGLHSEISVDGTYFTEPKNARIMAQTQLKSAGYPLSAVNFVCNRYGYNLSIGEPIVVEWSPYGISRQIYRVTSVDYGTLTDGRISVTALEDVFGFDQTDYAFNPSPVWTDPEEIPEDVAEYLFIEMPYELTYSLNTYIHAMAAQPTYETIQWYVWRYMGSEYSMRNTSTRWCTMGRMVYGYDEKYDGNDTIGFEISYMPQNSKEELDYKIAKINENPYTYTNRSKLNLLECNGEIMSYSSIELLANGHYRISGVTRGVFDTVPKGHVAYDVVHFLDYSLDVNQEKPVVLEGYTSHESLEITTSSQTETQDFDPNKTVDFDTLRRSESPSIMGNLKFGADRGEMTTLDHNFPAPTAFCHDIKFTFKTRNKFVNTNIMAQDDESIDIPVNLKNVIYFKCDSDEYEIKYDAYNEFLDPPNLEDMTFKWADFCRELGQKVKANNNVYMEIKTYNPDLDLYSYDHYEKQIVMLPPVLVGIVANTADVQTFANSIVYDNTVMEIPQTAVTEHFALDYEQAALIFLGTQSDSGQFYHLDGTSYDITAVAYRIDGAVENTSSPGTYIAKVHEVSLDDYYIFKTNYTGLNAPPKYYQRLSGSYIEYNIYTPPID